MAARIRGELQTDVDMIHGSYGEFKVLVDGDTLIDGGSLAFLGAAVQPRSARSGAGPSLCMI